MAPSRMLDIGSTFLYDATDEEEDYEQIGEERCTVMGYIYYDGDLFYTCIGDESGRQFDMYWSSVVTRLEHEHEDQSSF